MHDYKYLDSTGRNLSITSASAEPIILWQSQFAVSAALSGRIPDSLLSRSLTVSDVGNFDDWLERTAGATLIAQYSVSGGSLEIWAPSDKRGQGLGRWVGDFHEVTTFLPFQMWDDHEFVLGYFGGMRYMDVPEGVRAEPSDPSTTLSVLNITALVPDVGLLEIMTPSVGLGMVPTWSGYNVGAGEVWKVVDESDQAIVDHLVLSSTTAVATMTPVGKGSFEKCLTYLSRIESLEYGKAS